MMQGQVMGGSPMIGKPWEQARYDGQDMVQFMARTPVSEWGRMTGTRHENERVLINGEPIQTDEDIAEILNTSGQ